MTGKARHVFYYPRYERRKRVADEEEEKSHQKKERRDRQKETTRKAAKEDPGTAQSAAGQIVLVRPEVKHDSWQKRFACVLDDRRCDHAWVGFADKCCAASTG